MRSMRQLGSTPREWARMQRADRERSLAAAQDELDRARDRDADWYRWVLDRWGPYRRGEVATL